MSPVSIAEIIDLLAQEYGSITWRSRTDPLSELIVTILSQNTSDHNSRRAFDSLLSRFGTWEAVAEDNVEDIAEAIKLGGWRRLKRPGLNRYSSRFKRSVARLTSSSLRKCLSLRLRPGYEACPG